MTHADTAADLVFGDRNKSYGSPAGDFTGLALIWSGLLYAKLKEPITPEEVALLMVALKLRREAHRPKADNLVDAHGYLLCLEWIQKGERPQTRAEALNETLEDVCCGTRITCPTCGKQMPCMCEHAPGA